MLSDWISFLTYPNLFGIKDFIVVVVVEISRITNPFSSVFIYKKRDERDGREPVEIKIKIRPFQLQMAITFNRKL
jgi:hypothetical protein